MLRSGKSVMFDCGIHPGFVGPEQLPNFDALDDLLGGNMEKGVDVILITHFHLDHCAALPYLVKKSRMGAAVEKVRASAARERRILRPCRRPARQAPGPRANARPVEQHVEARPA